MSRAGISPTDIHVGQRLRALRLLNNKSQEYLADVCDISFQQIQKYEKGTNRLSASRMQQLAKALGVEPAYFFDGTAGTTKAKANGHSGMEADLTAMAANRHGAKIIKTFLKLGRPAREALAEIAEQFGKIAG